MTGLPYAYVGPLLLMAAVLFLAGALYRRVGLKPHRIPAAVGATGVALSLLTGFLYGMRGGELLFQGMALGLLSASLAVYGYQIGAQLRRADRFQRPFKGFYFSGKGEGM